MGRKGGYNGGLVNRTWEPGDDEIAKGMYEKGFSLSDICKKMNSGYSTVREHLIDLGVYKPTIRDKEREAKRTTEVVAVPRSKQFFLDGFLNLKKGKPYVLEQKPASEMFDAKSHLPEIYLGKCIFVCVVVGLFTRHFYFKRRLDLPGMFSFSDSQLLDLNIREV